MVELGGSLHFPHSRPGGQAFREFAANFNSAASSAFGFDLLVTWVLLKNCHGTNRRKLFKMNDRICEVWQP